MQNLVLYDVKKIDEQLEHLHSEGAQLRALQQQHSRFIDDERKRVEAEYASTLKAIDQKDKDAESNYRMRLSVGNDAQDKADSVYSSSIKSTCDSIRKKYDNFIRKDKEYIADLEDKCKTMAKNNDRLLKKYGTIPSSVTQKPNLSALFSLFDRIMLDTAESFMKRTFHKDGFYAQDDMIRDFISESANAISYLNYEITVLIPRDCNAEMQKAMGQAQAVRQGVISSVSSSNANATQQRSVALYNNEQQRQAAVLKRQKELREIANKEKYFISEEQAKIIAASKRKDAFFETPLVAGFIQRTEQALKDTGIFDVDWINYSITRIPSKSYALGLISVPVKTESKPLQYLLAQKIPSYCTGSAFNIPLLFDTASNFKAYFKHDSSKKEMVYQTIQLFLLQKLRSNPSNRIEIYFSDPNERGKNLGILNASGDENRAIGIEVNNTKDGIVEILKSIVEKIDERNGALANYSSVYEFNNSNGTHFREIVLVLCDVQNCINQDSIYLLKVIWQNASRCGISIVLTSQSSINDLGRYFPNTNIDWSFLGSRDLFDFTCLSNGSQVSFEGEKYPYILDKIKSVHGNFLGYYRKAYSESLKIDNRFAPQRANLYLSSETDDERKYGRSINGIKLPIMIDTVQGTICRDFVIGTENSQHTLITGGTGSGKSRLLQMIISSIILNYHPDDVELWLIDCKKVEFKKFLELRPPHVRMVSLERTQDFTFAFFDYLLDFAQKRTKLLMSNGVTNLKDFRKIKNDPYCMPRVVIIIDEFHAITQNVNLEMKYRQLLEDALSEYRNLGISFIFSDQSVSGLKGLTEKGRLQLHNRVAMKNSIGEIKETLQLLNDNYLPDTLMQMEKSEGYGDFWWNRTPNIRYKNIFIDDITEEKLIREVIARGETPKQDTKVILVDGNERSSFNEASIHQEQSTGAYSTLKATPIEFFIGIPTTLDEKFSFSLMQKYNNNVLIMGRDTGMAIDVVTSMLLSVRARSDVRLIILADSMSDSFQLFSDILSIKLSDSVEVYQDYDQICTVIDNLHEHIHQKMPLPKKTILFWFGLLDMYDEFNVSPQKATSNSLGDSKSSISENSVRKAALDPNLIAMAKLQGISIDEMLQNILSDSNGTDDVSTNGLASNQIQCYNATQDMLNLFAMGGKYDLFSVVLMEHFGESQRIKGFKTDNFLHKIAFCMSRDESIDWGLKTASELNERLTALYTDGIKQYIFKPYTHTNGGK